MIYFLPVGLSARVLILIGLLKLPKGSIITFLLLLKSFGKNLMPCLPYFSEYSLIIDSITHSLFKRDISFKETNLKNFQQKV